MVIIITGTNTYVYTLCQPKHSIFYCRHERVQHEWGHQTAQADETGTTARNNEEDAKADSIFNYHNARIQCRLLFFNIMTQLKREMAIGLCDKVVVLSMYKLKLIKYAYILILLFAKPYALFPEKEA